MIGILLAIGGAFVFFVIAVLTGSLLHYHDRANPFESQLIRHGIEPEEDE